MRMWLRMPKWWVHNKWAEKFGITLTSQDLDWINDLVDFPKKHVPNSLGEHVGHDWGRHRKWETKVLYMRAYERYGDEGILAVQLHHLLDILDEFTNLEKRQQMDAFKKATKKLTGTRGILTRPEGRPVEPPYSTRERVIPAIARKIQGLLGKCCYCGQPLAGETHVELSSIGGRNVCAHERCHRQLAMQETFELSESRKVYGLGEAPEVLDPKQIKQEVIRKGFQMEITREIIKFVMTHFWEILDDIENTRGENSGHE